MKLKIRKIAKGHGILLPKKMVERLKLSEGEHALYRAGGHGISLSPQTPARAEELEAFRRTEARHRQSYRELSK